MDGNISGFGEAVRSLLGFPGTRLERLFADEAFLDEVWASTNTLLEFLILAAETARQPTPLDLIAITAAELNPDAPSAAALAGETEVVLDGAEGWAFVTAILPVAAVLGAYLVARPLEAFLEDFETMDTVEPLEPETILSPKALHLLFEMCSRWGDEALQGEADTAISDTIPRTAASSGHFLLGADFRQVERVIATNVLIEQARIRTVADTLGVEAHSSIVGRMIHVARGSDRTSNLDGVAPIESDDLANIQAPNFDMDPDDEAYVAMVLNGELDDCQSIPGDEELIARYLRRGGRI